VKKLSLVLLALLLAVPGTMAAEKEMKVGFVYVSPIGDAGWSYAHDQGRLAVEAMDGVSTAYVEAVQEGPDSERVILNYGTQGLRCDLRHQLRLYGSHAQGGQAVPQGNLYALQRVQIGAQHGNYFGRMYQARYLTGMVAGAMTKSNILGYAAAFPIPEVIRGINAFALGAQSVNPKAQVRVVWTKTWYDPATEKEAAKSLLDVGADVIAQHQDSPGPQEAAQEKGVYSIGYNSDMSAFAPKAHMTAPIWNWGPYYTEVVDQVRKGTWKTAATWIGMKEGIVDIAPFGPMVPQAVQDQVLAKKKAIIGGKDDLFSGPIKDQNGAIMIAAGKTASDGELLGMKYFVQGVIGTLE
jgi:basic membrane protein A